MNYGIIDNRRPAPRGASSVNGLLADPRMREIAKQMGLEPKDFGGEAQALWNTLNDLSTSDPKRYESFINEQLQDGPPSTVSNQAMNAAAPPRFFTPDAGFVVKCSMYHSVKCQQKETKLFLNICAHKLIDAPKNPNSGQEVPPDTRAVPNTNSLQVPLVVGKLRELTDFSGALCCAVDVVVNPWVLRRSEWDANFKREVMKLAVQWVQEDARVRLVTPTGKFIKALYKGGVAVGNEIITSKFRIEDADPAKQRMESPADLLKQINLDEAQKHEVTRELAITPSKETNTGQMPEVLLSAPSSGHAQQPPPAPVQALEAKSQKKKALIEELPSRSSKQKATHGAAQSTNTNTTAKSASNSTLKTTAQKQKKGGGTVKRGFLNSTKAQLYPKGSNEGRPSSSYVNLLSRSKIVDLGEMERQRKTQQDERKQVMELLKPTEETKAKQPRSASSAEEIDHGDHIFEQLCEQADPDLKPTAQQDASSSISNATMSGAQLFGEGFEELAKLLTP
ncbi:hypothetical protein PHYPSEUDO_009565 [Phytophthora pseudosyringae]|uniref:PIH1 N-terminal domain-containing protein n=1 Tax=Phytophthora pseudosyringae TaxID=221518 RepID=A0A8T1WJI5_9STRA|nr:hypothetical protein PHYPSEUDO_009565 [Phytophthora pseudosyringae]